MTHTSLKLKAKDPDDLQVISAILQDAIAPVMDMLYRPDEKDFIMVVHRYCREGVKEGTCYERIRSAVHVRGVTGAQLQGIDQTRPDDMLEMLAIMPDPGSLQFIFAGGGKIRLTLADWSLILDDFGEAWPATCDPCHEEAARG